MFKHNQTIRWLRPFCWVDAQKVYLFLNPFNTYVVRCAIWYYLYNLKNVKNTHGGVLILVKLQAEARGVFHVF